LSSVPAEGEGVVTWGFLVAAVVMAGVVGLAIGLLLFRDTLAQMVDWNCPQCCVCGRSASRARAWTEGWRIVHSYPAEYCRDPECYAEERRRFTPPWLCAGCAKAGWRAEDLLLPEDERP
jgi:hypothetical protein